MVGYSWADYGPPKNFKPTYSLAGALLSVRDYFQVLWQKAWELLPGGESPRCPQEAQWDGGAPGPRATSQGAGSWLQDTPSGYFSSPVFFLLE